jgi:hypothetical protein
MAHVTMTVHGGTERDRERIREALGSYFDSAWGEVIVELVDEGARWNIDLALWRAVGASPRRDCREQVANALALAGIAFRRPVSPPSASEDQRPRFG